MEGRLLGPTWNLFDNSLYLISLSLLSLSFLQNICKNFSDNNNDFQFSIFNLQLKVPFPSTSSKRVIITKVDIIEIHRMIVEVMMVMVMMMMMMMMIMMMMIDDDDDDDASPWLETSSWWQAGTERLCP